MYAGGWAARLLLLPPLRGACSISYIRLEPWISVHRSPRQPSLPARNKYPQQRSKGILVGPPVILKVLLLILSPLSRSSLSHSHIPRRTGPDLNTVRLGDVNLGYPIVMLPLHSYSPHSFHI